MIEDRLRPALEVIYGLLADQPALTWAITGSLGMALQGLPVTVQDIDLQTDASGAQRICAALHEFVQQPLVLRAGETLRSWFAVLEIEGVTVEVMGDIQHRDPGGEWQPPVDLLAVRRWAYFDGMMLPVLSIAHEAAAYRRMGRAEKAAMLQAWADKHPEERVEAITNYLVISPLLATGGQPLAVQIEALARSGYRALVNLALPGTPYALEAETALAAQHGLAYHAIPVVWEAPTLQNLADFFATLRAHPAEKTFAHCVLNMRVSCFVFLYRVIVAGVPVDTARADMLRIWQPNPTWQRFLTEAGQAYGIKI